jgi:hypothetical protein
MIKLQNNNYLMNDRVTQTINISRIFGLHN